VGFGGRRGGGVGRRRVESECRRCMIMCVFEKVDEVSVGCRVLGGESCV
jgi:hypothetical protein